jgi:hypothetical protein
MLHNHYKMSHIMNSAGPPLTILSGHVMGGVAVTLTRDKKAACETRHFKRWWVLASLDLGDLAGKVSRGVTPRLLLVRNCGAQAADGLGLAGKADVGADRLLALRVSRAVHATISPPAAIRQTFLYRDILRDPAWRDLDFGGECGTARNS